MIRMLHRALPVCGLAALLGGCADDDALITDVDRAREAATDIISRLAFPGAERGPVPAVVEGGPRIERMCGPERLRPDAPVAIDGVLDGTGAAQLSIRADFATVALALPIEVDAAGHFAIEGHFGQPDAEADSVLLRFGAVVDGGVNAGPGISLPVSPALDGSLDGARTCTYAGTGITTAIAFGGDNDRLMVTGNGGGRVETWDVETGRRLAGWPAVSGRIRAVAMSPDGALVGAGGPDGRVLAWRIDGAPVRAPFSAHSGPVSALRIDPVGGRLASASWDGTARIYHSATGEASRSLDVGDRINALALSADGTYLAAGSGRLAHPGRVVVWRLGAGVSVDGRVLDVPLDGQATALAFVGDGRIVVAYGLGGVAVLGLDGSRVEMGGAPDDLAAGILVLGRMGRGVMIATLDGRLARAGLGGDFALFGSSPILVEELIVSPSGRWLAAALLDGGIRLADLSLLDLDSAPGAEPQ